jgi:acyl-CoA hydrolase
MLKFATYQEKLMNAQRAVKLIQANDEIIVPIGAGEPPALLDALVDYEGLDNNVLYRMLPLRNLKLVEDPTKLRYVSMFLHGDERRAYAEKKLDLLPNHFSNLPAI